MNVSSGTSSARSPWIIKQVVMVALCNRETIYIFIVVVVVATAVITSCHFSQKYCFSPLFVRFFVSVITQNVAPYGPRAVSKWVSV